MSKRFIFSLDRDSQLYHYKHTAFQHLYLFVDSQHYFNGHQSQRQLKGDFEPNIGGWK